jgi:glucokinase
MKRPAAAWVHELAVLEVGGTHVEVSVVDPVLGEVVPGTRCRHPLDSGASKGDLIASLLATASSVELAFGTPWVVAIPGPFDYQHGVGHFQGIGKFEALDGVDLSLVFRQNLTPRPMDVHFVNDAFAFLFGEWCKGAAKGHQRAVGVTLGTGVGSAFLADGDLVNEGAGVPLDGYACNLAYGDVPLEETVSRRAILAAYLGRGGDTSVTDVREIASRARRGDLTAAAVFAQVFQALGNTLAPCLSAFGATVLVVGGSIAGSWDLVGPPLKAGLMAVRPTLATSLEVFQAEHPADSALIGAALYSDRHLGGAQSRHHQ